MDIKIEETENSLKIIKSISILKMKLKNIMVGDMKYLKNIILKKIIYIYLYNRYLDWIRDKSNYLNGK